MAERECSHHSRKPKYLRAAAIVVWALQGIFAPWLQPTAYAATPDTIRLSIRAVSSAPPAAITDLLASPNLAIPGQVSLTWTAPQGFSDIPGATVSSYIVHYATFSADDLLGNTTSWWNATLGSSTTLRPPAYNPQSPGSLEAYTFTSLAPNTIYYFAIRSTSYRGTLSAIDTKTSTPGQQAFAFTGALVPPATFTGTALSSSSIQWSWSPVPGATAYPLYSDPANTLLQTITAPTTTWIETNLAVNTPYSRKAQATNGVTTTGDSPIRTVYTLANVPITLAISGVTTTSIALSWNANSNPSGTNFALERSPDGVTSFTVVSTTTATNFNDTGLSLNTTYYYRARAINGDGIVTAYTAVTSGQTAITTATPRKPNGILATPGGNGMQVTLSWTPVTIDTNGNPISVDHYLIYRYITIGDTPTVAGSVNTPATTFTATTGGQTLFYRIQAVSSFGTSSTLSDYLDSSADANRYALADNDIATRVVMPHDATIYLLAANNPYRQDLEIVVEHQPQDEVNTTLRSYRVQAQIASTGQVLSQFSFPQNNISVELGYGSAIVSAPGGPVTLNSPTAISAATLAQILSVYWYNGSSYVRIGNPLLTVNQSISVTVRNIGIYQIRAIPISGKFRLAPGSPYPRVITPNGAENRRVFWFFENPSGDVVTGTVYDIRGARVRDLQVNAMSPNSNVLVWDGRDSQGAVVPSGVYLYKISTPDGKVTGTVVVAR